MSLDTPDLQKRLDAMVTDGEMPGAQLSILADGEITSVASGVLNLRTGVPVTTESLFQIGSVSKIWTASAVMRLVDAGAVDLDAPVRTYLPTLQVGDEDTGARVTLRHLLDHTSGIEGDVFDDTGRNDDALDRYLALLADLRPSFALGETWSYCNAGFAIAGRIIADHAGSTFEQAIRDQLAAPLGIERFAWNADEAILHSAAVGHVTDPDSGEIRVTPSYGLPRNAGPAGLVTTTTGDLLEFARMHLDGGVSADGTRILSEDAVAEMQRAQTECPGALADHWGVGWMLHDWQGDDGVVRVIGHGGATLGQYTELYLVPEQGLAIGLCVNGPKGEADHALMTGLFADLAGVTFPPRPEPPADPVEVDLDRFVGTYRRYSMISHVERGEEGGLQVRTIAEGRIAEVLGLTELPPAPLVPSGIEGAFVTQLPQRPGQWAKVSFYGGDDGTRFFHSGGRASVRSS